MITAREVTTPATHYLDDRDSLGTAATMMRDLGVSSLPICDDGVELTGMLTDRDIVVQCLARGRDPFATTASELADAHAVVAAADETIESALFKMAMFHVRRLPVVHDGRLLGMLVESDLTRSLPDEALDTLLADNDA